MEAAKMKRKKAFSYVLGFLLFSVTFIGLVNVSKAAPDTYFVDVQVLGRNTLFKGDSASIRVESNASQVQLNIYDSASKTVFSNTVTANSTTVFSVLQRGFGCRTPKNWRLSPYRMSGIGKG
jgi:cytoskeletal protein RodZ